MGAIFVVVFAILPIVIAVPMCHNDSETICKLCEDYTNSNCQEITDDIRTIFFYQTITNQIDYNFFVGTNVKVIKEPNITTFYSCNNGYIHVNRSTFYPTGLKLKFTISYREDNKYAADRSNKFQICLNTYCLNGMYNTLLCHHYYLDHLEFNFGNHVTPMCLQNITSVLISVRHLKNLKNKSSECSIFRNLSNLRMLEIQFYGNRHPLVDHYQCVFYANRNLVGIRINNNMIWNNCNYTVSETNGQTLWGAFICVSLLVIALYWMVILSFYLFHLREWFHWSRQHIITSEDPGYELHTIRME